MNYRKLLSIAGVIACVFCNPVSAVVDSWPVAAPQKLSYQYQEKWIDGMETIWYDLSANGFAAKWFPTGEWRIQTGDYAASMSFYQRHDSSIRMQLYVYPSNRSLPDLSSESLDAYLGSLPFQYPLVSIIPENTEIQSPPLGAMPLFGASYRLLKYNLLDKKSGESLSRVCDFLSVLDSNQMVILRFTAPTERMQQFERFLTEELSRFTLD